MIEIFNQNKLAATLVLILMFFTLNDISYCENADTIKTTSIDSSKIALQKANKDNFNITNTEVTYETVGSVLEKSFQVLVFYDGNKPVKNLPVYFQVISMPPKSEGTIFRNNIVYTDSNGFAESYVILGSEEGDYEFSARIKTGNGEKDIVYFKAFARNSNWVFFLVSGLLGGLGLFLFGMELMSKGMKKTAGGKLRVILESLTNNKLIAVGVGTFITMIIQSSSATTVMLVSFVQAQLMTFTQTLGIILGAGIGTTITAQMIAFKLTDYALIIIAIGFVIAFLNNSKKIKSIGEIILGFGILFFGIHIMSSSMFPLRTYQPFLDLLLHLENPFYGIIVGTIFTALIQSSSAFTGIIIILGTQGLVTLDAAIPLILGANIGTSITAILATINTSVEAKRVALAHTLFKVIGVLLFVWWIPYFADFIRSFSPEGSADLTGVSYLAEVVPRQIANAHTVFNIALTFLLLPFTNVSAKLIIWLLPDKDEKEEESIFKTKFLEDSLISTPALALNLAKAEIIRMASKVQKMVENIIHPFFNNDEKIINIIEDQEREVNYLNNNISNYLIKISQENLPIERADEVFQMMHCVRELEEIGDVVSKRLIQLANKRLEYNLSFSIEGKAEIEDYHLRTMKQISRAIEVLKNVNLIDAKRMEKKYKKYRLMEMELRRTHFDRVSNSVPESVKSSGVHIELIDLLKRISSNATNIARIFLEAKREKEAAIKTELTKMENKKKKNKNNKDSSKTK